MSYTEKYYVAGTSKRGVGYRVSIQKKDYDGSASRLHLLSDGVTVDYKHDSWFNPIIGQSASFSILNNASNWYDLEDIATLNEKEFRVVINASDSTTHVTLFDGFINSDVVTQKYLNNSKITLTASNYISKLDNVHPTIIDTTGRESLINLINESLKLTGKANDIRVNCTLEPSGTYPGPMVTDTKTVFNLTGVDKEIFWKNDNERNSAKEIITDILKPLDCYIYWWNDRWYIERYPDAWPDANQKHYTIYDVDLSYGYEDNGGEIDFGETPVTLPITSFTDKAFIGQSQNISMIPGLQYLEIKNDIEEYINLTSPDLGIVKRRNLTAEAMYPPLRGWEAYYSTIPFDGYKYPGYYIGSNLLNPSIGYRFDREQPFPTLPNYYLYPGMPYKTIGNSIYRYDIPRDDDGVGDNSRASLCTRFRMTIYDEKTTDDSSAGLGTTLNLKWKFAPLYASLPSTNIYDYQCNFFIRIPPGGRYVAYNTDDQSYYYTTLFSNALIHKEIKKSDLDDNNGIAEINIDIPMGKITDWPLGSGDFDIIFGLMGEETSLEDANNYTGTNLYAHYGDFKISANSGLQNNRILAEINNNVLNKETIDLRIFDIDNLNYKNGLFYGETYENRTMLWIDEDISTYYSLSNLLIRDKFQLFNKNRRKIDGTLHYPMIMKPFTSWIDTADPSERHYLLTDYTYNITEDSYKCSWLEYDNTQVVNLNLI